MSCRSESRGPRLTKLFGRRKDTIPEDRAVSPEQYAPSRRMRSGSRPPPDSAYSSAGEEFKAEHDLSNSNHNNNNNNNSNDDYGWGAPQHSTSRSVSDSRSRSTTRDFGRGSKRYAQHSPDGDVDEDVDVDEQVEYDSDTGEWVKTVTTTTTTKTTTTTTRTKRTGRGKSRPNHQRKKIGGKTTGNSSSGQPDQPSLPPNDVRTNTHNGTQTRTSFSPKPSSGNAYNQSKPPPSQNDQPSHGSFSRRSQSHVPNQSTSRSVAPSPSRPATNTSAARHNDWPEPPEPGQQPSSNYAPQSSTKTLGVLPSPTNSPTGSASSVYEHARSSTTLNDQYNQHSNAGRSSSRDPSYGKQVQGPNGESSNSYGASQGSSAAESNGSGRGNPQFTINGSSISSYGGQPLANHGSNNRDSSATRQSDGGMQSDSSGDCSRADSGISVGEAPKAHHQWNHTSSNGQHQQRQRNASSTRAGSRDELQQQGKAKYQQGGLQGTWGSSWLSNRNSGDSSSSVRPDSARKPASWAQPHSPPDPLYNPQDTVPYFHSIGGVSSTSRTGPLPSHEAAPSPSVNRDQSVGRRWFG